MTVRAGINGFGRVGRCAFRSAYESGAEIEWAAINDVGDVATLAHLLRHDTVYGPFPGAVVVEEGALVVDGTRIPVFAETAPEAIPWLDVGAEVVLECTGKFRTRDAAAGHISAGAEKVIVSAPGKKVDATLVLGVNFDTYDPQAHAIVSNASCTTNCLAPVVKVLHEGLGIRHGVMTTIHAYTGDQRLVDLPHKDLRRARAAAANIVPTSTGAAAGDRPGHSRARRQAPGLRHARSGPDRLAHRPDRRCSRRATTVAEVNSMFAGWRPVRTSWPGSSSYSDEPLVSSDVIKSPFSSVFDSGLTLVAGGTQVKVVAWYDNEWGYSTRLAELAQRVLSYGARRGR